MPETQETAKTTGPTPGDWEVGHYIPTDGTGERAIAIWPATRGGVPNPHTAAMGGDACEWINAMESSVPELGEWEGSWVVSRKVPYEVIGEVFDRKIVERFNPETFLIESIGTYLRRFNAKYSVPDPLAQRYTDGRNAGEGTARKPVFVIAP